MESLTLTTQVIVPSTTTTSYKLVYLSLNWFAQRIDITLQSDLGANLQFLYGGPNGTDADRTKATNLMIALNKANLSLKSLQRRVIEQLVTDGFIIGTVTGVPD